MPSKPSKAPPIREVRRELPTKPSNDPPPVEYESDSSSDEEEY